MTFLSLYMSFPLLACVLMMVSVYIISNPSFCVIFCVIKSLSYRMFHTFIHLLTHSFIHSFISVDDDDDDDSVLFIHSILFVLLCHIIFHPLFSFIFFSFVSHLVSIFHYLLYSVYTYSFFLSLSLSGTLIHMFV